MSGVVVAPDKEAEMYESFCVFKTEPKNTCLRCRLGTISNNRAPSFPRWEPESLWVLFSGLSKEPGDHGSDARRPRRLEDSPRGTLASYFTCCAGRQASLGLWAAKDTTKRTGSLGTCMVAVGPADRNRSVTRRWRRETCEQLWEDAWKFWSYSLCLVLQLCRVPTQWAWPRCSLPVMENFLPAVASHQPALAHCPSKLFHVQNWPVPSIYGP